MPFRIVLSLAATSLLMIMGLAVSAFWMWKVDWSDRSNYQTYVVNTYESSLLLGHPFPILPILTTKNDTVYTDFGGKKAGIVLLFTPSSCQPCLEWILKALGHINTSLKDPSQLPIYAITNSDPGHFLSSQYRRAFKLDFEIGYLLEDEKIDFFLERTPLILLIGLNNTIILCHHPLVGKTQFTALFFQDLIFQHFPSMRIDIEGFADSPLKELHGLALLDVLRGNKNFDNLF